MVKRSWWGKAIRTVPHDLRKGLNSLIILVAWEIWKHQNSCMYEGLASNLPNLIQVVADECTLWCMVGASKLQELLARSLAPQA
uniref:Uncharacterized protein n=1 Tax=Setaria viridis TaxID=4556 RepID=A0A4U6SZX4_SETVI|nr:hypothetical protein SEVIR_9G313500v2 [Setaria viridis]